MRWICFLLLSVLVFPVFGNEEGTTYAPPGNTAGAVIVYNLTRSLVIFGLSPKRVL